MMVGKGMLMLGLLSGLVATVVGCRGQRFHPESPRQQLDKAGNVKKESPKQLQSSIGQCRDMLWEMRDVLAPSACAYAMNNIIQKEKKNMEAP